MYILYISLFFGVIAHDLSVRRLIIGGQTTSISRYPYAVSLMYCKPTSGGVACASFCSGSLIANDVILTAGHCVYDSEQSSFRAPVSTVPIDNMFVLLGSDNYRNLTSASGAKLAKVSRIANRGYGMNLRFPLDDDIGLVFLSNLVETVPGQIETIKILTTLDETESCQPVTSVGFGRSANVPSEIFVNDGKLRALENDVLHSTQTCRSAYIEAHRRFASNIEEGSKSDDELGLEISESKHFCSGGSSVASTCFGDSGGPVVVAGSVAGVISFGPLTECMLSPDYAAKVGPYAQWIHDQVSLLSNSSHPVSDIFTSWPPPPEKEIPKGRCPEWQCAVTGQCIALSAVCDGKVDCVDGSDEEVDFCHIAKNDEKAKLERKENEWRSPIGIDAEFDALLAQASDRVMFEGSGDPIYGDAFEVVVIGSLVSVDAKVRAGLAKSAPRKATPGLDEICPAVLEDAQDRMTKCSKKIQGVSLQILEEITEGFNRFEYQPIPVIEACRELGDCAFADIGLPVKDWLALVDYCNAGDEKISPSVVSLAQFCGDKLPYFLSLNSSRVEYAEKFNERFGEPECIIAKLPQMSADSKSSDNVMLFAPFVWIVINLL